MTNAPQTPLVDTPRTNAVVEDWPGGREWVSADFARQLERELAWLLHELQAFRDTRDGRSQAMALLAEFRRKFP